MLLLRHGESEFNAWFRRHRSDPGMPDPDLTETGRRQALAAATELGSRGITRILSSPYTRALRTAYIVNEMLNVPLAVTALAGERVALTCDEGTPKSQLQDRWPDLDFGHLPEIWWPAREEAEAAFGARMEELRGILAAGARGDTLLLVAHHGVIHSLTGTDAANCTIIGYDAGPLEEP